MTELSKKADALFLKIGDKGVMPLIYLAGLIAHTPFALRMEAMSVLPDEFGAVSWATLFAGGGVNGVMPNYRGWMNALFYAPVMLVMRDSFTRYKAMLFINGAVISLIPVIVYAAAKKLGVEKAWHRVVAAFVCGVYPAVFAHSKFLWDETLCFLFPWLAAFIILTAFDLKNRAAKHFFSILSAFVIMAAIAANPRMLALAAAFFAVLIFAKLFLKKELVCLSTFLPSLALFATVFWIIAAKLSSLTGVSFTDFAFKTGGSSFIELTAGHLYYFASATWGLGVLGVCLFAYSCAGNRRASKQNTKPRKKTAEEIRRERLIIFSAFALVSALFGGFASVLSRFGEPGVSQDAFIFGRIMDSFIPLVLMAALCDIFINGLDLRKLLTSVVALGGVYTAFFALTARELVNADKVDVASVISLYPLRIGERIRSLITADSLFLTVSSVFCVMAFFIVSVCCSSEKRRIRVISLSIAVISAYSCAYAAFLYLPFSAGEARERNRPVYEISEYLFDSADAPEVVAFDIPRSAAELLQFLNKNDSVIELSGAGDIPENCFLVMQKSGVPPFGNGDNEKTDIILLGETDDYLVWAYGGKAAAYALSQRE